MAKIKKKNKPGQGRPVVAWPLEKVKLLKKLYPTLSNDIVADKLNTTVSAVRYAAMKFKVKKSNRYWDKPETDYLLKNWPVMSAEEIAAGLKEKFKIEKTRWAVINKYRELKGSARDV